MAAKPKTTGPNIRRKQLEAAAQTIEQKASASPKPDYQSCYYAERQRNRDLEKELDRAKVTIEALSALLVHERSYHDIPF